MNTVIVTDEDVAELTAHAGGLWPAHRLPSLKARSLLRWLRKPVATVCIVLSSLFDEDPDATYPVWRTVRARLYVASAGREIKFAAKGDGFDGDRSWWARASAAGNDNGVAQELLGTPSDTDGRDCHNWMVATDQIYAYRFYRLNGADLGLGPAWPEDRESNKWQVRHDAFRRCWQLANVCRVSGPNTRRIKDAWLAGLRAEAHHGQIDGVPSDPIPTAEVPF